MALGTAYITVRADTKMFRKDVIKGVEEMLAAADKHMEAGGKRSGRKYSKGVETEVAAAAKVIGRDLEHGIRATDKALVDLGRDAERGVRATARATEDVAATAGKAAEATVGFFSQMVTNVGNLVNVLGKAALGFGNIGSAVTGAIADAVNLPVLVITVSLLTIAIIALGVALGGLLGLVVALVAVIGQLVVAFSLALLPAVIGLTLALGPLLGAFVELGPILGALFADAKQFNKALEKLDPTSQKIAKGLRAVADFLKQIAGTFILEPLIQLFTTLKKVLGPTFKAGMIAITKAWGQFFVILAKVLGTKSSIHDFQVIFAAMAQAITRAAPIAARFFQAILDLAASPGMVGFLQHIGSLIGGIVDKFSAWVEQGLHTGELDRFFADAAKTLDSVLRLLGAIGNLFGSLITPQTVDNGRSFLDTITEMINKLAAWFRSPEGHEFLHTLYEDLLLVTGVAIGLIKLFGDLITITSKLAGWIGDVFTGVVNAVIILIDTAITMFNWAIDALNWIPGVHIQHIPIINLMGSGGGGGGRGRPQTGHNSGGGPATGTQGRNIGTATQPALHPRKGHGMHSFALGGMTPGDGASLAIVHPRELVLPLSDPGRAASLLGRHAPGLGGNSMVHVMVSLDGRVFHDYVATAMDAEGHRIATARAGA